MTAAASDPSPAQRAADERASWMAAQYPGLAQPAAQPFQRDPSTSLNRLAAQLRELRESRQQAEPGRATGTISRGDRER